MKKNLILACILVTTGRAVYSETLSFSEAWKQINSESAAQESSRLQAEFFSESKTRASRHWLPKFYIDAKSYQTNDPGASFFGLLEQRSLLQSDFSPDTINHPESNLYTRAAIGVDLPLYEGGMKSAQVELYDHSLQAQKNTTSQIQIEQYSQVGLAYGSLAVIAQQKNKLQILSSEIQQMMKRYQLGNKSNPVGYSGLLGMKSLANRLTGLLSQQDALSNAYLASLQEMGLKIAQWNPEVLDSNTFVDRYFPFSKSSGNAQNSFKTKASLENVKAAEQMATMEKAKFLPRLGAFAESYMFSGKRDTTDGYNAGLYLQWSLFDPSQYGSLHEAKLKSMAVAKYSEATVQQERAEHSALIEQIKSLKENISLLNESYKILIEQSKMTDTLFRNGSINALQIVEVANRRADLIAQQGEAELSLIKASTQIVTKQKFDIFEHLSSGEKNEK